MIYYTTGLQIRIINKLPSKSQVFSNLVKKINLTPVLHTFHPPPRPALTKVIGIFYTCTPSCFHSLPLCGLYQLYQQPNGFGFSRTVYLHL